MDSLRFGVSLRSSVVYRTTVGTLPQARAALAARTALACTASALLIFAPLPAQVRAWLPANVCALAPAMTYMCCFQERGDTMRLSLIVMLSPVGLVALGTAVSYLCLFTAPDSWRPWVLCAAVPVVAFPLTILGAVAQDLHMPHFMLVSPLPALWHVALVPVLLFSGPGKDEEPWRPIKLAVCLLTLFAVGALVAILASFLPTVVGGTPARRRVPGLLAAKMNAVADFLQATTLLHSNAPASWAKCHECRLEALRASVAATRARAGGKVERWYAESEPRVVEQLERDIENCRLAVQLTHFVASCHAHSGSGGDPADDLVQQVMYRGPLGEVLLEVALAASQALRSAAQLLGEASGVVPVYPEGFSHPGQGKPTVEGCRKAAQACADVAATFQRRWGVFARSEWKDRVKVVYGEVEDAYLQDRAIFDEVSLAAASHLAAREIANAALAAAQNAAEAVEQSAFERPRCVGSRSGGAWSEANGLGLAAWLRAPFAGKKAWVSAKNSSWKYALRLSIALLLAAAVAAAHPSPYIDANLNKTVTPGFWLVVTVGLCVVPRQGAAIVKALHRLLGTALGAIIALLSVYLADGSPRALLLQVPTFVFLVKFFDQELQYLGTVCMITYFVVISTQVGDPHSAWELTEMALERVLAIAAGVVIAVVVSVFVAPEQAVGCLRSLELKALEALADTTSAATGLMSAAAARALNTSKVSGSQWRRSLAASCAEPPPADDLVLSSGEPAAVVLSELRGRLWRLQAELFFGGDNLPGIGDMLSDVRWEARIGTDRSRSLCGCVVVLPGRWLSAEEFASGRRCLRALPELGQALRIAYMLVALLEPELSPGAERVLSGELVAEALGSSSAGLAASVQGAVAALQPLLVPPQLAKVSAKGAGEDLEQGVARPASIPRGWRAARDSLDEASARLDRLSDGMVQSRAASGGAIGPECPVRVGGLQAMAAVALVGQILERLHHVRGHLQDTCKCGPEAEVADQGRSFEDGGRSGGPVSSVQ